MNQQQDKVPIQEAALEVSAITTVAAYQVGETPGLDPVRFYLQDLGPGQGRLTVECYGRAWAGYWGAMGKDMTIRDFLLLVGDDYDYLAGVLTSGSAGASGRDQERYLKKILPVVRAALLQVKGAASHPVVSEPAATLYAAIRNLRDCRGRHHTEMACRRLYGLLPEAASSPSEPPSRTRSEHLEAVVKILRNQLGYVGTIDESSHIIDDLGADSLDTVELIMALEEEYGIDVPDEATEKMSTVSGVVTYLEGLS